MIIFVFDDAIDDEKLNFESSLLTLLSENSDLGDILALLGRVIRRSEDESLKVIL